MSEWGILQDNGLTVNPNWARCMGGLFDDGPAELISISVYLMAAGSGSVRLAVYQGGSLEDGPDGATLVWDGGTVADSGSDGWYTATYSGAGRGPQFESGPVWVAVKGNDSTVDVRYSTDSADSGNFQSERGRFSSGGEVSSDETAAWPDTWPADTGSFGAAWYSWKLEYKKIYKTEIAPVLIRRPWGRRPSSIDRPKPGGRYGRNLQGAWLFNEMSGNVIVDYSGKNNNGRIDYGAETGLDPYWNHAEYIADGSMRFTNRSGATGVCPVDNPSSWYGQIAQGFTILFRGDLITASNGPEQIICFSNDSSNYVSFNYRTGPQDFEFAKENGGSQTILRTADQFTVNEVLVAAARFDTSNGMYVAAYSETTGNFDSATDADTGTYSGTLNDVQLMSANADIQNGLSGSSCEWGGNVAALFVLDIPLSDTQIERYLRNFNAIYDDVFAPRQDPVLLKPDDRRVVVF